MRFVTFAFTLLSLVLAGPGVVAAQAPTTAAGSSNKPAHIPKYTGQRITYVVDDKGILEVPVYASTISTLYFPGEIKNAGAGDDFQRMTRYHIVGNRLELQPYEPKQPEATSSVPRTAHLRIECNGLSLAVVPVLVGSPDAALPMANIVWRSEQEIFDAAVQQAAQALAAKEIAEQKAKQEEERRRERMRIRTENQQRFHSFARNVQDAAFFNVARYGTTARYLDTWQRTPAAAVRTTGIRYTASGPQAIIFLEAVNHSQTPQIIRKVKLTDIQKSSNPTRDIFVEGEAIPAGIELDKTLLPGERTLLAVVFDNVAMDTYALQMTTQGQEEGAPPKASETWFIPIDEPKSPNEGRRTIYAKGLVGGMWLGDESMPGKLKPAVLGGYGARLTYGFTEHIEFDGEFAYAKSGGVDFSGVERSASLLRIQFGGLLRFGKTYMPTVRAGLGLYGASQRRKVTATGMETSDIEVDLTLTGGIGLDVKISDGWVIGGALSLDRTLGESRSLEFAIHLGYGWTPKREPRNGFGAFGG